VARRDQLESPVAPRVYEPDDPVATLIVVADRDRSAGSWVAPDQ
jgi:hypothetical protein